LILYGLAETAGAAFMHVPGDSSRMLVPVTGVGFSCDHGELILVDAVFGGYLGDPQTESAGEIRSGDVAHLDAGGRLLWAGRRESLSPQVVDEAADAAMLESELEALSVVDRAIVIRGATGLTAFIVPSAANMGRSASLNGEAAGAIAPAEVRELLAEREQSSEIRLSLRVLSRPLTIEAGHLTPTGRPRRGYLAAMHADPALLRDLVDLGRPDQRQSDGEYMPEPQ
jgi:long-subunit acyl-CoA synthetase (AMP-forming)